MRKIVLFLVSLASFHPGYYEQLSGGSRKKVNLLVWALYAFSTFSALMIAKTLHLIGALPVPMKILLPGVFILIFLLEKLILHAHLDNKIAAGLRIALALTIAGITSNSAEILFFHKSVENFQLKQTRAYQEEQMAALSDRVQPKLTQRNTWASEVQRLSDHITSGRLIVLDEIRNGNGLRLPGYGPVATDLYKQYQADSSQYQKQVDALRSEMTRLDGQMRADTLMYHEQMSLWQKQSLEDPFKQLRAIHQVVFGPDGTIIEKIFFVLIHLLLVLMELGVIIGKYSMADAIEEYLEHATADQITHTEKRISKINLDKIDQQAAYAQKERELLTNQEKTRMNHELQAAKAKGEHGLNKVKSSTEQIRKFQEELKNLMDEINKEEDPDVRQELINQYHLAGIFHMTDSAKHFK